VNTVLWVVQVVLAIKFVSVAFTHGVRPDETKMQRGKARFGALRRPLLVVIALCVLAGAAGLVLPAAVKTLGWLAPWSAAALAALMLIASGLHLACRDNPKTWATLIIGALAGFVAYGRWMIAPL
jgi:hypothetical protein